MKSMFYISTQLPGYDVLSWWNPQHRAWKTLPYGMEYFSIDGSFEEAALAIQMVPDRQKVTIDIHEPTPKGPRPRRSFDITRKEHI